MKCYKCGMFVLVRLYAMTLYVVNVCIKNIEINLQDLFVIFLPKNLIHQYIFIVE